MIRKRVLYSKGKKVLKAATVVLTAISLISMAQLSACAATKWVFWGDQEEISEENSDNVCVTTLYKGQKEQFLDLEEVSGEISWSVDRPEILSISEDGELIPLKVGNTRVTITVSPEQEDNNDTITSITSSGIFIQKLSQEESEDLEEWEESEEEDSEEPEEESEELSEESEEIVYQYYVSVCKKKAYKAVKKARNALGATYSQAKRMKKGYYDCSSLIWRSYSPYGILFGDETWAPTAADQGLWCDENEKTISESAIEVSEEKLLPGDLIYYTKDVNNGRYKRIYHVAMFEGYEMETDEETGEATLSGTIIEAAGKGVVRNTYKTENREIALIARPTK